MLKVKYCADCGYRHLDPLPDSKALEEKYSGGYVHPLYKESDEAWRRAVYGDYIDLIVNDAVEGPTLDDVE